VKLTKPLQYYSYTLASVILHKAGKKTSKTEKTTTTRIFQWIKLVLWNVSNT